MLGGSATAWDPTDPDGVYDLDLDVPAQYQVRCVRCGGGDWGVG